MVMRRRATIGWGEFRPEMEELSSSEGQFEELVFSENKIASNLLFKLYYLWPVAVERAHSETIDRVTKSGRYTYLMVICIN